MFVFVIISVHIWRQIERKRLRKDAKNVKRTLSLAVITLIIKFTILEIKTVEQLCICRLSEVFNFKSYKEWVKRSYNLMLFHNITVIYKHQLMVNTSEYIS